MYDVMYGFEIMIVEIWFFEILNFVKVKLGSPFKKYFLTINDLYNGAKIVNLPLGLRKTLCHSHVCRVATATGKTLKKRNAC